jgi:hypothetical protein
VLGSPAWWNSFTSWLAQWWHVFELGKNIGDKAVCLAYLQQCKNDIIENTASCSANRDPMKPLYDATACQNENRAYCSTASGLNVQCVGPFNDENCKKAAECGLDVTAPQ